MYLLAGLLSFLAGGAGLQAQVQADPAGKVRFYHLADSDFDDYSSNPSVAEQKWMREHYYRMQTYAPYFDSRLSWYPDAYFYRDAYAIYTESSTFSAHPEWVLRDSDGDLLYIPWGCSGGTCPQYAADFGNPAFRSAWIGKASASLEKGYRGIWIDDVNMTWRVGNGEGDHVTPIDPRTGRLMTLGDWRRYFAEFMEEIRAAFPDAEIAHNAIWFAGPVDDPYIQRQIAAADYFNFERGATDGGLTGGGGTWGFETFLAFIDSVQKLGTGAILMDTGSTELQREYGLAAWFLISSGIDMMNSTKVKWTAPDTWWAGYGLDLGGAAGSRRAWQNVLRRDFSCGTVLLNQPGMPTRHLELSEPHRSIAGAEVSSVTLDSSSAAILLKDCAGGGTPLPPVIVP